MAHKLKAAIKSIKYAAKNLSEDDSKHRGNLFWLLGWLQLHMKRKEIDQLIDDGMRF